MLQDGRNYHNEGIKMSKTVGVSLTIPEETLKSVKAMAEEDRRTLSAMVSIILSDAVKVSAKKSR